MSKDTTAINTRRLGGSSIEVTEVGIGLWAQGGHWGPVDDAASLEAIEVALDEGVTFFDTADVYGEDGHSERVLAKAMKGRRDRFLVGTKIGWIDYDGDNGRSQYDTVDKLVAGVESNLRRLDTDHVELIQCHIFYRDPTSEVFIEGFRKLKQQGKVRAWGISTGDLDVLKFFNQDGDCDTLQIDYSILNRHPEQEIFPYCRANDIGVIVRGPLAMGILTGKFDGTETFPEGDFRKAWIDDEAQHAQFRADLALVDQLKPIAAERTLAQLALGFVLANDTVTTVIPGARNRDQALKNCSVARLPALSPDELAAIDALVPPGGGRKIWPA
jgi:aryl-alcohol dehydrogenase-like predicted oxidoreductase